jgi:hypothetical protein
MELITKFNKKVVYDCKKTIKVFQKSNVGQDESKNGKHNTQPRKNMKKFAACDLYGDDFYRNVLRMSMLDKLNISLYHYKRSKHLAQEFQNSSTHITKSKPSRKRTTTSDRSVEISKKKTQTGENPSENVAGAFSRTKSFSSKRD